MDHVQLCSMSMQTVSFCVLHFLPIEWIQYSLSMAFLVTRLSTRGRGFVKNSTHTHTHPHTRTQIRGNMERTQKTVCNAMHCHEWRLGERLLCFVRCFFFSCVGNEMFRLPLFFVTEKRIRDGRLGNASMPSSLS